MHPLFSIEDARIIRQWLTRLGCRGLDTTSGCAIVTGEMWGHVCCASTGLICRPDKPREGQNGCTGPTANRFGKYYGTINNGNSVNKAVWGFNVCCWIRAFRLIILFCGELQEEGFCCSLDFNDEMGILSFMQNDIRFDKLFIGLLCYIFVFTYEPFRIWRTNSTLCEFGLIF